MIIKYFFFVCFYKFLANVRGFFLNYISAKNTTLREDIFAGRNFCGTYFCGIYFCVFAPNPQK